MTRQKSHPLEIEKIITNTFKILENPSIEEYSYMKKLEVRGRHIYHIEVFSLYELPSKRCLSRALTALWISGKSWSV